MKSRSPRRRQVASMSVCLLVAGMCLAAVIGAVDQTFSVVTPTRIMLLGDSITRGAGSGWGEGYRLPLVQRMSVGRYSSDLVGQVNSGPPWLRDRQHEGYGGYGIDDIAALAANEVTIYRPDIVLLMIGSNDMQWGTNLDTAPSRLSNLIDIVTSARPTARVVVASVTPLANTVWDARVQTFNATIPEIVQNKVAAGKLVSFVDMYPVIDPTTDLIDGVHPNDAGYAKLAAAWGNVLAGLRAAPPAASSRSCPCSIWSSQDAPTLAEVASTTAAELGVKFQTEKDGFITAIRFYKGANNVGPHVGSLWKGISDSSTWDSSSTTMSGELLAQHTVTTATSSGWQEVVFPNPVPVSAHTAYFASYYAPFGRYPADSGYFREREIVNSPVRLLAQGSVHGNGFIHVGSPGLPGPDPQHDTNYWVDVVFVPTAPDTPSTLTATAQSTSIISLSWSPVTAATGYRVERSQDPAAAQWTSVASTASGVTSYSDTGLAPATTFYYRVRAVTNGVESSPSVVASATTQSVVVPQAPSTLTAAAQSSSVINLSWSPVTAATGYRVERSQDPAAAQWTSVASTAAGVTSYSDTGLAPATTFYYRVRTVANGLESSPSVVANATTQSVVVQDTTPPTAPSALRGSAAKAKINLSFTGSTDSGGSGLAGYTIWRAMSASGPFANIGWTTATSYSDSSIATNTSYWYRVTALDRATPANESQPSNTVSVKSK